MSIFGKIVEAIKSLVQGDLTKEAVEAKLTAAAASNPERLDWQHSIVDLMKLLDMDSSLEDRKELAEELGYDGALDGSAAMNTWLHAEVMQQLAEREYDVPKD